VEIDNFPGNNYIEEPQAKRALSLIEGNTLNIAGDYSLGLWLHDHRIVTNPDELPMLMQVKNNLFNLHNESAFGAEMIEGVNAVIRNNKFTGTGAMGFYADALNGMGYWSENCLFMGNNFSTAAFSDNSIWLGPFTRNFTVIGGNNKDRLQNNGTNNVITGFNVNTSPYPVGQTIVDNLNKKREEMIKRYRK
jgi:hypothetical protein